MFNGHSSGFIVLAWDLTSKNCLSWTPFATGYLQKLCYTNSVWVWHIQRWYLWEKWSGDNKFTRECLWVRCAQKCSITCIMEITDHVSYFVRVGSCLVFKCLGVYFAFWLSSLSLSLFLFLSLWLSFSFSLFDSLSRSFPFFLFLSLSLSFFLFLSLSFSFFLFLSLSFSFFLFLSLSFSFFLFISLSSLSFSFFFSLSLSLSLHRHPEGWLCLLSMLFATFRSWNLPFCKPTFWMGRPNIILQVFACWDLCAGALHDLQHSVREQT